MSEPEKPAAENQAQEAKPRPEQDRASEGAQAKEAEKPRPKARRLSEEERKELWHRAVIDKARKLKLFSDWLLFLFLVIPLGAHALTFVGPLKVAAEWEPKRGYEVVMDLLTKGTRPYIYHRLSPDGTPMVDRATGRRLVDIRPSDPADALAFAYLAVPFGAVLLIVLYLLDYVLWMGRFLPGLSMLYGFGAVAYLAATRLPENGTWNAMRLGSLLAWYLLMIPLFFVGAVSMLRFFVSQRWKRYEFAGLPVPEHLKPRPPAPPQEPAPGVPTEAAREGAVERPPVEPPKPTPAEAARPEGAESPGPGPASEPKPGGEGEKAP